jgi:hypothetical protein
MLSRQRQLLTKLHKLLDAGLFAFAFWLAHAIRSIPVLDPNQLIKEFDAYAWLLLVIVPLTPPVLDMNRFYSRPVFYSRRETLYQLIRSGIWVSLVVITVLFVLKVEGARGVMLLFTPLAAGLCFLKDGRPLRQQGLPSAGHPAGGIPRRQTGRGNPEAGEIPDHRLAGRGRDHRPARHQRDLPEPPSGNPARHLGQCRHRLPAAGAVRHHRAGDPSL